MTDYTQASTYHRGYADGLAAHDADLLSLDLQRAEVIRRLRGAQIDGGSHENLSSIARCVMEPDYGWTVGACMSLRDELVRLLGGKVAESLTAEGIVRDLTLGIITEREAVRRIERMAGDE